MIDQKDTYAMQTLVRTANQQVQPMLELLRNMVEIESPSDDKGAVGQCVAFVAEQCAALDGRIRFHRQKAFGNLLEARFGPKKSKQKPLLLLGHLDTVWPLG